ncbi:MAG: thioredoxin domain-containing protein [Rhodothermales bacterium]|nr:thioredoxin domain-containing protein [Rhodothermales bacterium]
MNRLQFARSPYLLQHRDNPVDWFPWGKEAFAEAARRDVPVFLSIGYATCHWCHVMEHESFEDTEVAELMNRHVVSIKVDREERPDIDDVYMSVCHLMGKQGGWPLTILMTPDKRPFYAGTYLPKHSRFGRIGMMDLIPRIAGLWASRRDEIVASANEVTELLERQAETPGVAGPASFDPEWIETALRDLRGRYDAVHGGFGSAPKFPSPHNLNLLARAALTGRSGDSSARMEAGAAAEMARDTILSMWRGGVFDQVGYGWHRYSTDGEWRLPHFEKMLHDQATMLDACVDVYLATGDERLREAGLQTAEYVLRDLRHPDGGFYSAEDADSEGEEGRFYVWSTEEIRQLLPVAEAEVALDWFGMTDAGNFLEEATRERTGTNVLHPGSRETAPPDELARIQSTLLEARSRRPRPLRDEKVLLDWNGLMIGALARAGRAFGAQALIDAAVDAHQFLRRQLKTSDGWLHRWFEGDAAVAAMVDD